MPDYLVVLIGGESFELRNAEIIKEEPELILRCGRAEYHFNWNLVAYYVIRNRE